MDAGLIKLECPSSPQQTNGHDCGIYAILAALHIATGCAAGVPLDESIAMLPRGGSGCPAVGSMEVAAYRHTLISIIQDVEREQTSHRNT